MATNVKFDEIVNPWDDCTCGRKHGDLHCPYCGSATALAMKRRQNEATLPDGRILENKCWYCRKCGEYYDSQRRLECSAPSVKPTRRVREASAKAAEKITTWDDLPKDQKAILNRLRKERGAEPLP